MVDDIEGRDLAPFAKGGDKESTVSAARLSLPSALRALPRLKARDRDSWKIEIPCSNRLVVQSGPEPLTGRYRADVTRAGGKGRQDRARHRTGKVETESFARSPTAPACRFRATGGCSPISPCLVRCLPIACSLQETLFFKEVASLPRPGGYCRAGLFRICRAIRPASRRSGSRRTKGTSDPAAREGRTGPCSSKSRGIAWYSVIMVRWPPPPGRSRCGRPPGVGAPGWRPIRAG